MSRGKAPNEITIRKLCSQAAGICEFEGCGKRLFYDDVSKKQFNDSYVAHIIASSQNGPRGNKEHSHELSDKIDNLMLMCGEHHKLIDDFPNIYTVDVLRKMKTTHEEKIASFCEELSYPTTTIITLESSIKNRVPVSVNVDSAAIAIKKYKTNSKTPFRIKLNIIEPYSSNNYWNNAKEQIDYYVQNFIINSISNNSNSHFSIFPIAPIPMIIYLGYILGDKIKCDIYQHNREHDTWEWLEKEKTNDFYIKKTQTNSSVKNIATKISISDNIEDNRLIQNYDFIYTIGVRTQSVDAIKSIEDLNSFWLKYQEVMNEITNNYGLKTNVDMYLAAPVSVAFEIGRRYMNKVYPKINIYDEDSGFIKTLEIGE